MQYESLTLALAYIHGGLLKFCERDERVVTATCNNKGVCLTDLRNGSRRGRLPEVRGQIVRDWSNITECQSPMSPGKWESRLRWLRRSLRQVCRASQQRS